MREVLDRYDILELAIQAAAGINGPAKMSVLGGSWPEVAKLLKAVPPDSVSAEVVRSDVPLAPAELVLSVATDDAALEAGVRGAIARQGKWEGSKTWTNDSMRLKEYHAAKVAPAP